MEALIAGMTPETAPTMNANNTHPRESHMGNAGFRNENPACAAIKPPALEIRKPKNIPIIPPTAPTNPDSIT